MFESRTKKNLSQVFAWKIINSPENMKFFIGSNRKFLGPDSHPQTSNQIDAAVWIRCKKAPHDGRSYRLQLDRTLKCLRNICKFSGTLSSNTEPSSFATSATKGGGGILGKNF